MGTAWEAAVQTSTSGPTQARRDRKTHSVCVGWLVLQVGCQLLVPECRLLGSFGCRPAARRPAACHAHAVAALDGPIVTLTACCLLLLLQVLVSAAMRYRVLLSHHVLSVTPLLELSPAASPSAADLTSYTLRLESTYSKVRRLGFRF